MRQFWNRIYKAHPFLVNVGTANALLAICCIIGMGIDDRTLLGVSVWLKPMKFGMSLAIVLWTLAWLLDVYPYSDVWRKRAGNYFGILALIEIITITLPAFWGIKSHYNTTSLWSGINFGIMGSAIFLTTMGLLVMAVQSFYKPLKTTPSITWAIRFGWIAMFWAFRGGQEMIMQSGHNIGIADGGAGLPMTNWSILGGDLRVMHFFGMHAMQILPLTIAYIGARGWISKSKNLCIFSVVLGMLYLTFLGYVYWQAKAGLPFIPMDAKP